MRTSIDNKYGQKAVFLFKIVLLFGIYLDSTNGLSQQQDTIQDQKEPSKFDKFNKKAEKWFTYIPAPIYSYSSEAGHVYGLAKFNVIDLYKGDTITKPSRISEVVTFSSKGRINVSSSTDLMFKDNKYLVLAFFNYKKTPEYIQGIGNNVNRDSIEEISTERFRFSAIGLRKFGNKNFYAGFGLDINNYFEVKTEPDSYLVQNNVPGLDGGFEFGLQAIVALEGRENRYNPQGGHFIISKYSYFPSFLGSDYEYVSWELDARKYFNPWLNHVVAIQATTEWNNGEVPFYSLAQMGGSDRMRGYYEGIIRDRVLVDGQIEYRMPVWNIFGIVGWIGTGRVAPTYEDLSLNGFRLSYGTGLRIMVDSKHQTNLRFDFGFGPNGVHGFIINFAEAF